MPKHSHCPLLTEEGWEIVGTGLSLLGPPEGPNPKGDEGRPTGTAVPQRFRLDGRMDVDQKETEVPSPTKPNPKKARGGRNSQATGSTQASQDDLTEAKAVPLPRDSDDEEGDKD